MKNLIVAIATASLLFSVPAAARDRGYHRGDVYNTSHQYRNYHRDRNNGGKWVAPLIGGIILGAVISRSNNREVVVQQPQDVYVYQTPPAVTCWETRRMDYYGNVYYTRECR